VGVSRQDIRSRVIRWLVSQHWVWWSGLGNTHKQASKLISGPCPGGKARFLSLNRTQSRTVIAFLLDIMVDGRLGSWLGGYHPVAPRPLRYGPFVHLQRHPTSSGMRDLC
jgi:hypothetical protein